MLKTNCIYQIIDIEYLRLIRRKLEYFPREKKFILLSDKKELWLVPISENITKYKTEVRKKIKKFGACQTILIKKIGDKEWAILFQKAFPILENYPKLAPYQEDGKVLKLPRQLQKEVLVAFKYLSLLKKRGNDLFFVNTNYLKYILIANLNIHDKIKV